MNLIGLTNIFAYHDGYPGDNGAQTLNNARRDLVQYATTGELPAHVVEASPMPMRTVARHLVGLPTVDAVLVCSTNGHSVRVASEDGQENIFTMELWQGIWLTVEGGVVTEAESTV